MLVFMLEQAIKNDHPRLGTVDHLQQNEEENETSQEEQPGLENDLTDAHVYN